MDAFLDLFQTSGSAGGDDDMRARASQGFGDRRPDATACTSNEGQFSSKGFIGHQYCFRLRSEEHTSELQSLMRISYAVFCLKKKNIIYKNNTTSVNTTHDMKEKYK